MTKSKEIWLYTKCGKQMTVMDYNNRDEEMEYSDTYWELGTFTHGVPVRFKDEEAVAEFLKVGSNLCYNSTREFPDWDHYKASDFEFRVVSVEVVDSFDASKLI